MPGASSRSSIVSFDSDVTAPDTGLASGCRAGEGFTNIDFVLYKAVVAVADTAVAAIDSSLANVARRSRPLMP